MSIIQRGGQVTKEHPKHLDELKIEHYFGIKYIKSEIPRNNTFVSLVSAEFTLTEMLENTF